MIVPMRTRSPDRPTVPGRSVGLCARGRRHDDRRLASLLSSDSDTVLVLRGLVVTSASDSARDLLGWEPSLCVGRTLSELMDGPEAGDTRSIIDALQDAAEAAGGHIATHRDLPLLHVDGQTVWVDATIADLRHDSSVGGTIVTFHDVTERRALEQRVRDAEYRDELTGVANRRMLRLLLDEALQQPQHVAVLLLDIDDFGELNDEYGAVAGDAVLVQVASRLADSLRAGDHLARVGSDEFALVVNGLDPDAPARDAAEVADRVERALRPSLLSGDRSIALRVTFGIATHIAGSASTADSLLAAATAKLRRSRATAEWHRSAAAAATAVQVTSGP